ncbi:hypothetical protein ACFWP3_36205 [Streptomyces sp. NPDC058525]|uniref:hypothetical protein n=1 Tax=Streptomyces sp. NPDC058525 TaxID=3346538 RepID=UPI0036545B4F
MTESATVTAAAGYIPQAVERALRLDQRISVARQLQEAIFTDFPRTDRVEITAQLADRPGYQSSLRPPTA